MKILYGVQATGNGHISRARAMQKAFAQHRHLDVQFLFSGRNRQDMFDMAQFGDFECKKGLTFHHSKGKLDTWATLSKNAPLDFIADVKRLDISPYDLVITDYEPITAWAAKRAKQPVIGIGHQYAFNHAVPTRGDNTLTRGLMRNFAPVDIGLGLHWHHFDQPILPPIADTPDEVDADNNRILVYLGFEDINEIVAMLSPFSQYQFDVFSKITPSETAPSHIHIHPLSKDHFKEVLRRSEGVICNAGFELASEAIQLGKKILVKPLHGQMEQTSNCAALEALNLAATCDNFSYRVLAEWLTTTEYCRIRYPNVAQAIADWIVEGRWQLSGGVALLAKQLWQQTDYIETQSRYTKSETAINRYAA